MTYCNHVWGKTPVSSLNKIVVLQKRAIRIICNVNRMASTDILILIASLMSMLTWYLDPCSDISMDLYLLCLLVTSKSMLIFIVIRLDTHFISISRMLKATLVKSNIRYRGAQIWNHLFELGIDSEAPELVFANCMKFDIRNSMLTALQTIGLLHPSVSRYMYLYGLTCHKNDRSFFFLYFFLSLLSLM